MPNVRTSQGTTRISNEGVGFNPSLLPPKKPKESDTHSGASTFGVVYANDIAARALSGARPAKFPEGSIIVREKLARADAAQPELIAVMFKRERGFNPAGGDWEFLTVDGTLAKIQARQKKGSCLDCHASQSDNDFIFTPPTSK